MRVEVAAAADRIAWLQTIPPWVVADQASVPERELSRRLWKATVALRGILVLVLIGAAALLARRNVRRGRGDRRGALRVGIVVGLATLAFRMTWADFAPGVMLDQLVQLLKAGIFEGFLAWLIYLALEPYLRRSWPRLLIGWQRLLAGNLRDFRVGREVLLGLVAGAVLQSASGGLAVVMRIADIPYSYVLEEVLGRFRDVAGELFWALSFSARSSIMIGLLLLLLTLVLRRRRLAVSGLWLVAFLTMGDWIYDLRYALTLKFLFATVFTVLLVRVGMLAVAAAAFAWRLMDISLTLDPTKWYFPHSLVPLVVLLALGGWAAWRALGEQAVLGRWLPEEPPRAPGI